jgi:3-isopropylmalate/(R)-2-methylmalate dehydratase small subunit
LVTKEELDQLMSDAENGSNSILDVDLESQQIGRPNGKKISFEVDQFQKHCLLNGLDEIGLTMEKQTKIDTFEKQHQHNQPWV